MKKKRVRQLLSRAVTITLCAGMCVSSAPVTALATDNNEIVSVNEAATEQEVLEEATEEVTEEATETLGKTTEASEKVTEETKAAESTEIAESTETVETTEATEQQEEDIALLAEKESGTNIATYAGEIPAGIEWADGVSEETFATPYSKVKAAAADGTEYTVEVVPKNIVYFIDSITTNFDSVETTKPYTAVKNLVGESLKNEKYDQQKTADNAWGLVDTDAQAKGTSNIDITDKSATGIYAAQNKEGETLSYALTLEAGTYTITSAHHEWWQGPRPMTLTVETSEGTLSAGTVEVSNSARDAVNSFKFTIDEAQTITYTMTATGSEAPVLSWLAVTKEETDGTQNNEYFGKVLDDNDMIETRTGASMQADSGDGKLAAVTSGWISGSNSAVNGGAVIKDADSFVKRTAFTLYFDAYIAENDANADKTSEVLIGTQNNNFRIIPSKTDGKGVLKVGETEYELSRPIADGEWSSVALVYSENDNSGQVAVYANGEELLAPVEIGFKLSKQSNNVAGFGVTYGTGFMRTGKYDNIVVLDTAASKDAANTETAARKTALDNTTMTDGSVVISGSDVDSAAKNRNGLTYKGFGMLNGNSTSNLLLDYKAENPDAYWDMMEYLFGGEYPLFTHIKMEMGNDGNNSTGA